MKNQYFGDVNDFRKYGLLRVLTGSIDYQRNKNKTLSLAVCWMLTPDDNTSHGNRTEYLNLSIPNVYNKFDSKLFNYFIDLDIVNGKNRHVKNAQNIDCLPLTSLFYAETVPSKKDARAEYFHKFLMKSKGFDIVFYDPDNGLNIKTRRYGTRYSFKHLYWCELSVSYSYGHSIILYQHFGMQPGGRDLFIEKIANDLKLSIGIDEIYSFKTSHMVFFLLPQAIHTNVFDKRIEYLKENWSSSRAIKKAGFNEIKKH